MLRRTLLAFAILASLLSPAPAAERPNIVYILADDLGYGDVKALNPDGKIPTPHLDRLAASGLAFTDAHSGSAVCSPTRYGILTGRYAWRTTLQQGVLGGYSRPLIDPGRLTVASFLKQQGYATACVGKWHLGMDWPLKDSDSPADDGRDFAQGYADAWKVDYARPIRNGPNAVGFDFYFGISASLDMTPFVFIRNTGLDEPPSTEKRWIRTGPAGASFEAEDVLPAIARESIGFLERQAASAKPGQPFFLYVPLSAPHTPILPTPTWQGRSGLNAYGDFVMQTDAAVGQVLGALDRLGLASNTLVIVTSDNGCSPEAKYPQLLAKGHNPSGPFRGTKADIFEGGHRVPFLVRWPGRVQPGTTTAQTTCLTDLFATCADILDAELLPEAAVDSVSMLPALLGQASAPLREAIVHHSINGSFAIRQGPWKLALCADSGGWSAPRPGTKAAEGLPPVQLYNLETDLAETSNVQGDHPEIVERLSRLLESYVAEGRSTPGPRQPNDQQIALRKAAPRPAAQRPAVPPRRPNILWLTAEDFGPDLGCYGQKLVVSPNLDRLAAQGVRFSRAYTTAPVCSASRSAFMTGMYQTTIGAHNHRSHRDDGYELPNGVRLLPDRMTAAGYFTANLRQLPPALGFLGAGKTDWNFQVEGQPFASDRWADLKSHQPFFAHLNFQETHRAFHAPKQVDPASVEVPPYEPDHPVTRADRAAYYDAARELDRKIGLVLTQLEADGLADSTIVVFFGDNGACHVRGKQFCYEEGLHVPLIVRWAKGFPIPKDFNAGSVDTRLVEMIDLAPTMLDFAGIAKPAGMQGHVLFGPDLDPPRRYAFGARDRCDETVFRLRTVRDDRYRYIRNFTPDRPFLQKNAYKERSYPVWNLLKELDAAGKLTPDQKFLTAPTMPSEELYDLDADPHEIRNLATSDDPAHRVALERLREALEHWIESTNDQGRTPEPPEVAAAEGRTRPDSEPEKAARKKAAPAEAAAPRTAPPSR